MYDVYRWDCVGLTELNKDRGDVLVDGPHLANLELSFLRVSLIDADRVCPDKNVSRRLAEPPRDAIHLRARHEFDAAACTVHEDPCFGDGFQPSVRDGHVLCTRRQSTRTQIDPYRRLGHSGLYAKKPEARPPVVAGGVPDIELESQGTSDYAQ